ncbi:hypothetical protein BC938DRAFT_475437, partial [Jimgerdemannia flammicorona]
SSPRSPYCSRASVSASRSRSRSRSPTPPPSRFRMTYEPSNTLSPTIGQEDSQHRGRRRVRQTIRERNCSACSRSRSPSPTSTWSDSTRSTTMSTMSTMSFEAASATHDKFPEGWFFIQNRKFGSVLDISNAHIAVRSTIQASQPRKRSKSQLWKEPVRSLMHCLFQAHLKNTKIIHDTKSVDSSIQEWDVTLEGTIYKKANNSKVLSLKEHEHATVSADVYIQDLKPNKHIEQRWQFLVMKTDFGYHANFPQSWFFIQAAVKGHVLSVKDSSTEVGAQIVLHPWSSTEYRSQLWKYDRGCLVNFNSKLVLDVDKGNYMRCHNAAIFCEKQKSKINGRSYLDRSLLSRKFFHWWRPCPAA